MSDNGESGTPRPSSSEVGGRIRERREELRLTAQALAERVSMSQAKISRIETGRSSVTPEDVRRIADALQMSPAEADELVKLAVAVRGAAERPPEPSLTSSTLAKKQIEVGRLEREAREIRVFQPTVVPGLLQNSGYAEAVIGTIQRLMTAVHGDRVPAALMNAVARRLDRQQILAAPDKRFFFLLMESALSNRLSTPEDQLAQIKRIRAIAAQPNVWLGIIPADAVLGEAPLVGFELLDDEWLMIDLVSASTTSRSRADIRIYRQYFDSIAVNAVTDIDPILDKYADLFHRLSAPR
ncbi:helix-turn-helix transcriptional regulator [Actinoplanes sp. NPDC024001]|uniref:helix-turn-helix domain-containing protein n=1 Tax=Actinoplanes sp. NPDC024001 TaxID=3154598 RepID=UPI003407C5C6